MNAAPTSPGVTAIEEIAQATSYRLARAVRSRGLPLNLEEGILYAALGGGKRLRPALAALSCEAAGGTREHAMPAAVAIEFVHAFSLVHDDLPSMDDDDVRRGRPTLHVQAGEAMAILSGDAMLALSFEVLADEDDLEAPVRVALVRELGAATTAMIGGQVLDTIGGFPHELDDVHRLQLVHRNKTGALLRAACRMGAISAGADEATLELFGLLGADVGLMFQIVDDLIDVEQTAEHAGKATGKDEARGKLTWPIVHGADAARAEVERLRASAGARLDEVDAAATKERTAVLRDLVDHLASRTA